MWGRVWVRDEIAYWDAAALLSKSDSDIWDGSFNYQNQIPTSQSHVA